VRVRHELDWGEGDVAADRDRGGVGGADGDEGAVLGYAEQMAPICDGVPKPAPVRCRIFGARTATAGYSHYGSEVCKASPEM